MEVKACDNGVYIGEQMKYNLLHMQYNNIIMASMYTHMRFLTCEFKESKYYSAVRKNVLTISQ